LNNHKCEGSEIKDVKDGCHIKGTTNKQIKNKKEKPCAQCEEGQCCYISIGAWGKSI
jgi:hypothetical protein